MNALLDLHIQGLRTRLDEIIKDLHNLASRTSSEEFAATISDLRNRLNEPFMFVIVGEVKSGKSSFVNALLESEEEICKTGPQPVTDSVQQILYGKTSETVQVNPHLKKVFKPIEILKDIAIVDTPGTNTIIEQHQEITEEFIPASDLIVFVFEAKNPYRQSAWAFFEYIRREWHKKVIFVLQQKDLMEEADLSINVKGVAEQAQSRGVDEPSVFAVSALQASKGMSHSGFEEVRSFIKTHITGGRAPFLKLENNLQTCQNLHSRIRKGLDDRISQLHADQSFRDDIRTTLEQHSDKADQQIGALVRQLTDTYDTLTLRTEQDLKTGLSFLSLLKRSFSSLFSRKTAGGEWLSKLVQRLEEDMHNRLQSRLSTGVENLADEIRNMAQMIDLKIRANKAVLQTDHELFPDIASRRNRVIDELQRAFSRFLRQSENFTDDAVLSGSGRMGPQLATGSGLAIVGIILAAVTQGMVFDITGGVLTALGLLFAGVTGGIKKRQVLREYREEVDQGKVRLESEVTAQLHNYVEQIKERIDRNFSDFDNLLEREATETEILESSHREIGSRIDALLQETEQ